MVKSCANLIKDGKIAEKKQNENIAKKSTKYSKSLNGKKDNCLKYFKMNLSPNVGGNLDSTKTKTIQSGLIEVLQKLSKKKLFFSK